MKIAIENDEVVIRMSARQAIGIYDVLMMPQTRPATDLLHQLMMERFTMERFTMERLAAKQEGVRTPATE